MLIKVNVKAGLAATTHQSGANTKDPQGETRTSDQVKQQIDAHNAAEITSSQNQMRQGRKINSALTAPPKPLPYYRQFDKKRF